MIFIKINKMSINDLPQEVQNQIYENLTLKDLSNLRLTEKSKKYQTEYIFNYKKVMDIINIAQYCSNYLDIDQRKISVSDVMGNAYGFARYLLTLGLTKNEILSEEDDLYDEDVDLNDYADSSTIFLRSTPLRSAPSRCS